MRPIFENYGSWLLQRVGFRKRGYSKVMALLHEMEFVWDHKNCPRDENRAEDGIGHRREFWSSLGGNAPDFLYDDLMEPPCSVLEMLVGLAIRCENDFLYGLNDVNSCVIFWKMCSNIDIDRYKNDTFTKRAKEKCRRCVNSWMLKTGIDTELTQELTSYPTIFPVKNVHFDPKNTEIWLQMTAYLTENYHF